MTKKVKPAKKAKKPADKTPEITKAAKALENYLKENNLDPAKDWSKDKTHGKAVKELMAKLNKEETGLLPNTLKKTPLIRRSW